MVLSVSDGKQQCLTPYKVGLRSYGSLNQETQVVPTTCASGDFCKLKLAELLSFSINLKKLPQPFQQTKKHLFDES